MFVFISETKQDERVPKDDKIVCKNELTGEPIDWYEINWTEHLNVN